MNRHSSLSPYEALSTRARGRAVSVARRIAPTVAVEETISFERVLLDVPAVDRRGTLEIALVRELTARLDRLRKPDPSGKPAGLPTLTQLCDDNPGLAADIRAIYRHLPVELLLPEKIGPYQVMWHIADGGQGRVVEARDPKTFRSVIVKYSNRGQHVARLRYEAAILHQLDHPGIRKALGDLTQVGDYHYLVLELVSGCDLVRLSERGPISEAVAARIITQLSDIVGHLNSHGIYHCDIKPENVIESNGQVYLIDFGMAVRSRADANKLIHYRNFGGTPAYSAPELQAAEGQRPVLPNPRSEVYSLGATLFYLLNDRNPGPLGAPAITTSRQRRVNLSSPLVSICAKAMNPRPEDRFAGADSFAAVIRYARRQASEMNMAATAIALLSLWVLAAPSLEAYLGPAPQVFDDVEYRFVKQLGDGSSVFEYDEPHTRSETRIVDGEREEITVTEDRAVEVTVPADMSLRDYLYRDSRKGGFYLMEPSGSDNDIFLSR